jgi:hypothetical protein
MDRKFKSKKHQLEQIDESELDKSRYLSVEKKQTSEQKLGKFNLAEIPWQPQYQVEQIETAPYVDEKDTVLIEGLPSTMVEPLKERLISEGAVDHLFDKDNNRLFIQYPTPVKARQKFIELSDYCNSPVYDKMRISLYDHSIMKKRSSSTISAQDFPTPVLSNLYMIIDILCNW